MSEQTNTLSRRIMASVLLKPEQQHALLAIVEHGDPQALKNLDLLLREEENVLDSIVEDSVAKAVRRDDSALLRGIDTWIAESSKTMNRAEESAERNDDDSAAEHVFDNVS